MNGLIQLLRDRYQGKGNKRRSSRWPVVRAAHLEQQSECQGCGGTRSLEVHHEIPFSLAPSLELEPSNLITLCEDEKFGINCHLNLGHSGNYRAFNPNCRTDARIMRTRIEAARKQVRDAKRRK